MTPNLTIQSIRQGLDCADPNSYRMMQDVAVLSPLFLTEAAAPHLQKAPGGGTVVGMMVVCTCLLCGFWSVQVPTSRRFLGSTSMITHIPTIRKHPGDGLLAGPAGALARHGALQPRQGRAEHAH